jgi:hypothetical protein
MPATTSAAQIPAIVQWFQLYGNIVFFFAQLVWWIVTGFAAGWAACTFWRVSIVKMKMYAAKADAHGATAVEKVADEADDDSDEAADEPDDEAKDKSKGGARDTGDKVDVDKFVD